jgi:hypothetical protein
MTVTQTPGAAMNLLWNLAFALSYPTSVSRELAQFCRRGGFPGYFGLLRSGLVELKSLHHSAAISCLESLYKRADAVTQRHTVHEQIKLREAGLIIETDLEARRQYCRVLSIAKPRIIPRVNARATGLLPTF